ncbi:DUF3397 domain-containing protein [Bacillus salitolerans]|uniref:DUF3397 domain-containing protein n=1 Tax=Bacillus salitolerans TaxID=1437434 RepID=A0ABW4LLW4_9BACI
MISFFSSIIAILITVPLIGFILFFIVLRTLLSNKKKAFQYSIDITTLLLMISVYYLGFVIFNISLLSSIMIIVLLIAIIFLFLQRKINEEIHFSKVLKGVWRSTFLLFFLIHICLLIYGLSVRIWEI